MSKDRFEELQKNIEKYGDGTDISIIKHFAVVDMEAPYLEDFFNQVNALRNSINKVGKLIEDVEHLQNEMLAPQIIIGKKEKLEETMMQVKLLGHQIRKELNRMKQIHENSSSKKISQRIIEGQIDGMTKNFCEIMDKYYQSIINYREKCKERVQRQYQIAGFVKTDSQIEEMLETGRLTMYPELIIDTEQAKENLHLMELRHQEITNLEEGIRDLHDMIFDVANLIQSQGDQINTVMNDITLTDDHVKEIEPIIIDAIKVSHCFPSKKKNCVMVITIILIVYLISKIIAFL